MTVLHITAAIRALSIPRNRGHSSLPLHSVPRFSPENGFVVSANFAEPAEPQVHSEYQPIIARVLAILSRPDCSQCAICLVGPVCSHSETDHDDNKWLPSYNLFDGMYFIQEECNLFVLPVIL